MSIATEAPTTGAPTDQLCSKEQSGLNVHEFFKPSLLGEIPDTFSVPGSTPGITTKAVLSQVNVRITGFEKCPATKENVFLLFGLQLPDYGLTVDAFFNLVHGREKPVSIVTLGGVFDTAGNTPKQLESRPRDVQAAAVKEGFQQRQWHFVADIELTRSPKWSLLRGYINEALPGLFQKKLEMPQGQVPLGELFEQRSAENAGSTAA